MYYRGRVNRSLLEEPSVLFESNNIHVVMAGTKSVICMKELNELQEIIDIKTWLMNIKFVIKENVFQVLKSVNYYQERIRNRWWLPYRKL